MTKEQAIETLKKHKEQIDKKYINARNSDAIETVLSMLEEKDKQIDLMANEIADYNHFEASGELENKEEVKQYFENKAKEVE